MEAARDDLLTFTGYTMPTYDAGWHHEHLAKKLMAWLAGKIKWLIVKMPPQEGKSQLVSRHLPAWAFGKRPDLRFIATTYNQDYANKNSNDVQDIMKLEKYHKVFPNVAIPGDPWAGKKQIGKASSREFHILNRDPDSIFGWAKTGSYLCAGTGGGITGNPGKRILINDPIKNDEEADSPAFRDKLWDWWTNVVFTRLHEDSCVCVTATAWHEDDLIGRLLKQAKDDPKAPQWEVVHFEAIKEHVNDPADPRKRGEALWPSHFSLEFLMQTKRAVGSRIWSAL